MYETVNTQTSIYYHYQILCILHNCMCYILYALQQVCLPQHQHKHASNALCYDVRMAMTSLGDGNFSIPLYSMVPPLYVIYHWLKLCYIAHTTKQEVQKREIAKEVTKKLLLPIRTKKVTQVVFPTPNNENKLDNENDRFLKIIQKAEYARKT